MRVIAPLLAAVLLAGQTPQFDPADPDGTVMFPNGTGRYVWKRKGIWRTGPLNTRGWKPGFPRATAAEVQSLTATLNALTPILQNTPRGTDLIGYWMNEGRGYDPPYDFAIPSGVPMARLPIQFYTGFFPFYLDDILDKGKFVPHFGGETESVYFQFNSLPGSMGRPIIASESRGAGESEFEIYIRPQATATYAGFPVYENQDLILTRGGRDPWVAVPVGRALKAAVPRYEKDRVSAETRLAGLRKDNEEKQSPAYEQQMRAHLEKYSGEFRTSNPSKWQGRLAGMERELKYNRDLTAQKANPQRDKDGAWYWNPIDAHAEATRRLATMTADEAARPACYLEATAKDGRYQMRGSILPAGADPTCQPLVSDNYNYFDQSLPRSAAQILLVRSLGRCAKVVDGKLIGPPPPRNAIVPPQGCRIHVLIWEAMEWRRVAALLAP